MGELGFDLSDRRPQRLSRELAEQADIVVTMGRLPYIPGKRESQARDSATAALRVDRRQDVVRVKD